MQRSNTEAKAGANWAPASGDIKADLCVIGAGSGGLVVAAAAAALGEKVVLIEKHKMGGDCLNYGCVPSKALIAAGKKAQSMRTSQPFGIANAEPSVDWKAVHDHVHEVIAAIAPNDSVERFTGLGVEVIQATGKFIDRTTVEAGERRIKARRIVIATGSSAFVPPIPGLDTVPYLTNETIFDNQAPIEHLIIVGGGPIGMEMAQAHRRLGAKVTVIEGMKALAKDDPELTRIVLEAVRHEGVVIREGTKVEQVAPGPNGSISVHVGLEGGVKDTVVGSHLLVAAGRKPSISGLNLEAAGIAFARSGITVNAGLVTSNPKVFAIGDCVGGLQFTHVAGYHAGIVIKRALFRVNATVNTRMIPWVTYTDPEMAHVGLTEAQAAAQFKGIKVQRWPYHENDRAQAERHTEGLLKVVTDSKGVILGASIVGERAGEIIQMWALAISQKMKIKAMTEWISPYPTYSEINKRAAGRYYAHLATNALVRKTIGVFKRFG